MAKKCRDWASDPRVWLALAVVSGVATAIATAYVSQWLGLQNQALRAQLRAEGIEPKA